jgi:N-acetylmuramoyl-L-alanine amidase
MRRNANAEVEQVHHARTLVSSARAQRWRASAVLVALAVLAATASRSAASSPFKPPPKRGAARAAKAAAPAADAATIERVRYVADEQSTRVVVLLSRTVPYEVTVLPGERSRGSERRVVLDFSNAKLGAEAQAPIGIEDGLLKRIRTGQFTARTARVVLDLASVTGHHVEAFEDPPRIVVDIAGKPTGTASAVRDADHGPSREAPAATPSPAAESARSSESERAHESAAGADKPRRHESAQTEKPTGTIGAAEWRRGTAARRTDHAENARGAEDLGTSAETSRTGDKPRADETTHATNGERSRLPASTKDAARPAARGGAEETASVSAAPAPAPESAPPDVRASRHGREEPAHEETASAEPSQPPEPRRVPPARSTPWRIVLDPGHGGTDPGTHGVDGVYEKDVTLVIAKRLKRRLEEGLGAQVLLTRDRDVTRSLAQRTAFANASNADVFISIHTNADASGELHGIETYTLNNTNDRAAIRLAKMENGPGVRTGRGDLSFILSDMVQSGKEEESIALANRLQQRLISRLRGRYPDVRSLGVKKGPFYVLVGAYMPCVLVETSFLSHPVEGRRLASSEYQSEIVEGLYLGMAEFLGDQRLAKTL